jgi:transcriptional regulator with XRE-family HTH domain
VSREVPVSVIVGYQVAAVRKSSGITLEELAQAVTDSGVTMDRFAISKLERGRRQSIGVHEVFALAEALNVSPIHLMVPIEGGDYMVTPKHLVECGRARAWIRGQSPFLDTPEEGAEQDPARPEWLRFLSHMPISERRELMQQILSKP